MNFGKVVDHWDPILRQAFLDAVAAMRDRAQLEQIAKMLERLDFNGALKAVGLDPASFRSMDQALSQAFEAGGKWTQGIIPTVVDAEGFRTVFQFSVRNPGAESWLKEHSSTLITEILDDQRTAIRGFLEDGMKQGLNPRTVALDLVGRVSRETGRREGGVIGLASSQEEWVRNYEAELRGDKPLQALERQLRDKRFDRAVSRAAAKGEAIPDGEVTSMVRAYRNRALRYRAGAIGRSEAMTALHQAQQEALSQAVGSGVVAQSAITDTWRSSHDKRVRDAHRALDGHKIKHGGTFNSQLGPIRFPGDPMADIENTINCRCWLEPSVNFLAGVD